MLYVWRGDQRDLALRLRIAELRRQTGGWREALKLLRNAKADFPPHTTQIQSRMRDMFSTLIHEDGAASMTPLDFIALVEENADLLPPGTEDTALENRLAERLLALDLPIDEWVKEEGIADAEIRTRLADASDRKMAEKFATYGPEIFRTAQKSVLLQLLDQTWKDHLLTLDHLRQGISLRAYGQRDPLNEYKREAFGLFEDMLAKLRETVTGVLSHLEVQVASAKEIEVPRKSIPMQDGRTDPAFGQRPPTALPGRRPTEPALAASPARRREAAAVQDPNDPATWGRVQRNAPCPCGSGKKYKHCHGRGT